MDFFIIPDVQSGACYKVRYFEIHIFTIFSTCFTNILMVLKKIGNDMIKNLSCSEWYVFAFLRSAIFSMEIDLFIYLYMQKKLLKKQYFSLIIHLKEPHILLFEKINDLSG